MPESFPGILPVWLAPKLPNGLCNVVKPEFLTTDVSERLSRTVLQPGARSGLDSGHPLEPAAAREWVRTPEWLSDRRGERGHGYHFLHDGGFCVELPRPRKSS